MYSQTHSRMHRDTHRHLRECAHKDGRRAFDWSPHHKLQNAGLVKGHKDRFVYNVTRDVVIPTSNGLVHPRALPGTHAEVLLSVMNTMDTHTHIHTRNITATSVIGHLSEGRETLLQLKQHDVRLNYCMCAHMYKHAPNTCATPLNAYTFVVCVMNLTTRVHTHAHTHKDGDTQPPEVSRGTAAVQPIKILHTSGWQRPMVHVHVKRLISAL